jgi:hypothetical protein
MKHLLALLLVCLVCPACTGNKDMNQSAAQSAGTGGCIDGGGGSFHARLRGALVADLDWKNAEMQCAGGPRPHGEGLRVTFAGRLPGTGDAPARRLRFIFGIDPHDIASGAAEALPTNLTVIVEGEGQIYATRGDGNCAVENLEQHALPGTNAGKLRVSARGYCLGPATNVAGDARVLVPTFEFTGVADAGESN